jgi:hypothetical protein
VQPVVFLKPPTERLPSEFGETMHRTPSLRMKYANYTASTRRIVLLSGG